MKKRICALIFVVAMSLFAAQAGAADLGTALGEISANFPGGADTGSIGNAGTTLGYKNFTTENPSGVGAFSDFKFGATIGYGRINFKNGPDANVETVSGAFNLSKLGIVQLNFSNAGSGSDMTNLGADMKLSDTQTFSIAYGVKVADGLGTKDGKLYLGVGVTPVTRSKVRLAVNGMEVASSDSNGYGLSVGALYTLNKDMAIGSYYSFSRSEVKDEDVLAGETAESYSETHKLRIGASWQVLPMTLVAVDGQYLKIDSFKKYQVFAGIEQGIIKDMLYVYGGWAGDGPTAGVGLYFKHGGINIAYMNNIFKAAEEVLGKSRTIMALIYSNF